MAENLLELPPEILVQIFKLCSKDDLIKVACSNKECYCLVIHFLCHYFEIHWSDIVVSAPITHQLRNLKYASCLVLFNGYNPFYEVPPWIEVSRNYLRILKFCNPQELKTLCIIKSKIIDSALETTLRTFDCLQYLRIEECNEVSSDGLNHLLDLISLKRLHINACSITDVDIERLHKLPLLEDLSLVLCPKITEMSLKHISKITTLTRLQYCEYGVLPSNGFKELSNLKKLKTLDISGCVIDDINLKYLMENFARLDVLNVGGIELTPNELVAVSNISNLTRLGLSGCYINDAQIPLLQKNLKHLKVLDLSWNTDISDKGVSNISKMKQLTSLSLRFSSLITDDGVAMLRTLPYLRVLDLSVCELLTDACLIYIALFPLLKVLSIIEITNITPLGIQNLARKTNIIFEEKDFNLEDRENLSSL